MWFFVQLCSSWQDSNWLRASRGPSAIAELLVINLTVAAACNWYVIRSFDCGARHVTAFRPISEAFRSWSCDNHYRRDGFKPRLHDTTCYQTGCQTRLTTGLTTGCIVYIAGCQTDCTTWFNNRLNEQWLFVQKGCQTGCKTRFDNRLNEPVWQPVVSCKRGISELDLASRSMLSPIRLSVCLLCVVCNARAPNSGTWNFRQYFYGIWYLGHLTSTENFTEIVPGEPLRWGS